MTKKPKRLTVTDVFDALGGPAEVGRILGISTNHASVIKGRGSIPSRYWPRIVDAARARRVKDVTYDALAAM